MQVADRPSPDAASLTQAIIVQMVYWLHPWKWPLHDCRSSKEHLPREHTVLQRNVNNSRKKKTFVMSVFFFLAGSKLCFIFSLNTRRQLSKFQRFYSLKMTRVSFILLEARSLSKSYAGAEGEGYETKAFPIFFPIVISSFISFLRKKNYFIFS